MTVLIANTSNNQNFSYWLNRTNELAYAMSVYAVTANGSNAAVGNAGITGLFSANALTLSYNANVGTYIAVGPYSTPDANSAYVNTTFMHVGNVTVNSTVNAIAMKTYNVYIGSNVVVNTSQVFIGESTTNTIHDKWHIVFSANATANLSANAEKIQITNNAISGILTYDTLWLGNTVVNATAISTTNVNSTGFIANTTAFMLGPNLYANNTTLVLGYTSTSNVLSNSTFIDVRSPTGNIKINSVLISLANSSSIANLTSDYLRIGNSFVNSTIMTTAYANSMVGGFTANTTAILVGHLTSPVRAITAYANNTQAIYGESNSSTGVYGKSSTGSGVYGVSVDNIGVSAISNTSTALYAFSNTSWAGMFVSNTSNPLYVGNATAEFVRINSAGNLGINNASPTDKLSVNGNAYITNSLTTGSGTVNAVINSTSLDFNSTVATTITIAKPTPNGSVFFVSVGANNASSPLLNGWHFGAVNMTNSTAGAAVPRTTHYYSYSSTTNPTDIYYNIVAGNDAGMGTGIKIYANGPDAVSRGIDIFETGEVGIGNTAPLHKLSVNGVGFFTANLITLGELHSNHSSLAAARLFIAGTERGKVAANSSNFLMLDTNGVSRVFIDGSGNTGIGNAAPVDKLSVNGTTYLQGIVTATSNVNVTNFVNAAVHSVGSNFIANTTGVYHTGTANVNTLTSGTNTASVTAITGYSNSSYGVYGISNAAFAVYGVSNTSYGVYGISNSSVGVVGESKSNYGGYFVSTSGIPLFAGNNTTEFFRVTPTGNVGVGSTSATDSKFRVYDSNTLAGLRISYAGSSVNYYDANTHYFRDTAGGIRVTSNTTGVGIGNTSYTDMLAVGGSVYMGTTLQVVTSVNSAAHTVGTAVIANTTGVWTTGTVNAAVQSVGTAVIANTRGLFVANSVSTNAAFLGSGTTNSVINSTALVVRNASYSTVVNTSMIQSSGNVTITGAAIEIGNSSGYANVAGNMFVRGNLQVSGNLAYTGVATGDINPFGNTYNLGNTNNRWTLWAMNANVAGSIIVSDTAYVNTQIVLGNTSTTTQITIVPPNNTQRTQGNTFLSANGSWTALPSIPVTNNVVTTTGTTQQTIDTIALGTYAYDYVIHVLDSSGNRMATKILVSTNSSAINSSEYAQIGNLGSFTTDISAGSGYLYFTPSVSSTTVRFTKVQSS